jgi:hypothetical protein
MTDDVNYLGAEVQEAEGYLQPRLYKIYAVCNRCHNEFSWTAKTPGGKDRPCPRKACKEAIRQEEIEEAARKFAGILEQGPPAVIGRNNMVKAVDQTAEMVMQDFKMTDLRDNIKPGESMAPKLAAPLQKAADGFFGGGAVKDNHRLKSRMARLGAQAIAGSFKDSAINPAALVGGPNGGPAFRSIGKG